MNRRNPLTVGFRMLRHAGISRTAFRAMPHLRRLECWLMVSLNWELSRLDP